MAKRGMKQRVTVALATVWLASIVGASVPSGETTAFSNPRSSGPSPDQYTPLLRNPRYFSQDDYGQDWMNDEPSRVKVANRQEKYEQGKTEITNSDGSLPLESPPNGFYNRKIIHSREDPIQPKDMKQQNEMDTKTMKLSSIKVAFDEPIDSELFDDDSKEDWINDGLENDEEMQQDGFVSDDTFEDEGPGSVEVYKLDLYKDRSILSPKPSRKNYLKNKSKTPKKVENFDQIIGKGKDQLEETKQHLPKTVPRRFDHHTDEFSSSKSFKERIFGVGGVPELQVGCEGVEGPFQRQKRSKSDKSDSIYTSKAARATPVFVDADYDSEEESDAIGETDELFKILAQGNQTDLSLNNENRGDMNPRIKTPADLEAQKDKLPIRGDLGLSSDPNKKNATETQITENARNKRSMDWGFPETSEVVMNKHKSRVAHHRGDRRRQTEKGRQRHEEERRRERKGKRKGKKHGKGNEIRKRHKTTDKNGQNNVKKPDSDIVRNQTSNLLRQLPTRRSWRNEDYNRRQERQLTAERRNVKDSKTEDVYDRKLAEYKRRNTPIPRRHDVPPVHRHQKIDDYAQNRRHLAEQRRGEVGHTNRIAYELRQPSTERPKEQRQGRKEWRPRTPQEIARLKALPISAWIAINKTKSKTDVPDVESRFGEDPEVIHQGLNPSSDGPEVPGFGSGGTTKAPVAGPSNCVWAIMTCCSSQNRLASCFEAKGCYHGHWNEPCTPRNMLAALQTVNKHYGGS